ncbi:hypothetical protein [Glycomyces tritici]|uniref:Uncharacterized protein n=1 Tax=Glycomyces tritici TaxID=2665176 RepID=A0ABT7YYR9_9ACTN|nr:hypothetical protein [Glycomyces tritici]MDN3243780.1 hypothetical protein [Glycomyces tritici]
MRGSSSDQGGRWPVGIWFAMVGVSAGTVASFSLIGWTFARDLYGGGEGTVPLDYEPQTVVIEADATPDPAGVAGGDGPAGPAADPGGPGSAPQIGVSAAEPRAERLEDAEIGAAQPPEEPSDEHALEESTPPQLVPIGEDDGDCGPEEAADEPGWDPHWGGGWEEGWHSDQGDAGESGQDQDGHHREGDWVDYELPELELDLEFDASSIDLELESASQPAAEDSEPESEDPEPASELVPDHESGLASDLDSEPASGPAADPSPGSDG